MQINKKLVIVINTLVVVVLGIRVIDIVYKNSVYSNLDHLQTLLKTDHKTRYQLFIFGLTILIMIINLIFLKIKIVKPVVKLITLSCINVLGFNFYFYILKVNNISIILISVLSILLSFLNVYWNKKIDEFQ